MEHPPIECPDYGFAGDCPHVRPDARAGGVISNRNDMTIQQFIDKAIAGRWKYPSLQEVVFRKSIFLDPLAWQAVGRVDGWAGGEETAAMFARTQMHRMIDALADGKTIEEFLETL